MRNIEIKAKIKDYETICKRAAELSGGPPTLILQNDVFYTVSKRRLKMRFLQDSGVLVSYQRENTEGPKFSDYDLLTLSLPEAKQLHEILIKSIGARGQVIKKRNLYMVGQTRVHIDQVNNLGDYMELEVVLRPEQSIEEGQEIARYLQKELGVMDEDLINCAYIDLLEKISKSK